MNELFFIVVSIFFMAIQIGATSAGIFLLLNFIEFNLFNAEKIK